MVRKRSKIIREEPYMITRISIRIRREVHCDYGDNDLRNIVIEKSYYGSIEEEEILQIYIDNRNRNKGFLEHDGFENFLASNRKQFGYDGVK